VNKPDIMPGKYTFFKHILSRWLVVLALGLQTAIVAVLLVLSVLFTITFKRADSRLGSITEQVDYHFGMHCICAGRSYAMCFRCFACDRDFKTAASLGFRCIVGVYICAANHLACFIGFGDLYISGLAESDGWRRDPA